tara:strand:- start:2085 stop:3578 length:1494 start_codon:yes stop_codon:yes gene_type:complete
MYKNPEIESHGSTPCDMVHPKFPHDGWSKLHNGKWCTFIHPNSDHRNNDSNLPSDRLEKTINSLLDKANKHAQASEWKELKNIAESILLLHDSDEAKRLIKLAEKNLYTFTPNKEIKNLTNKNNIKKGNNFKSSYLIFGVMTISVVVLYFITLSLNNEKIVDQQPEESTNISYKQELGFELNKDVVKPTETKSIEKIDELRNFALELINKDRIENGVPPVIMGDNPSAQIKADESLKFRYTSHFMMNGEKPYMLYTRNGGNSYIVENGSMKGHTPEDEKKCKESFFTFCEKTNPKKEIKELQYLMMHDDAHAKWLHRKAILDPSHTKVNIGIAYNEWFLSFYQYFEGDHFVANEMELNGSMLSFTIKNVTNEYKTKDTIIVYYDPPPLPNHRKEAEKYYWYCVGGGASYCSDLSLEEEDKRTAAIILPPAKSGYSYTNLSIKEIPAYKWEESNNILSVGANLKDLTKKNGVYTIQIYGENRVSGEIKPLIQLSIFKE